MGIQLSYIKRVGKNSIWAPYPGSEVLPQSHSCYEVVFYDNGCSGITTIDGKEHKFNAGDIAFIHKNTVHSEQHFSSGLICFFGFTFDENDLPTIPENGTYSNMWDLKSIFYTMLKESINQEIGYEEILTLKIQEILLLLQRKINTRINFTKNMTFVKNYVDDNYMQSINVESLAKMTGYSIAQFRNLFTNAYGTSPKNYIIDTRCKNAAELLQKTSYSCTEIAYQCGFSNSGQMTQMLKRKYGRPPLHIRKHGLPRENV